jgi:hypothetical protein
MVFHCESLTLPVWDQYSTRQFINILFILKVKGYGVWEEFSSKKGETSSEKIKMNCQVLYLVQTGYL